MRGWTSVYGSSGDQTYKENRNEQEQNEQTLKGIYTLYTVYIYIHVIPNHDEVAFAGPNQNLLD